MGRRQAGRAAAAACRNLPTVLLARTAMCRGVSFMAADYGSHGQAPIYEPFETARAELAASLAELEVK